MPWTPHDLPFIIEKATRGYRDLTTWWEDNAPEATTGTRSVADDFRSSISALTQSAPLTWLDTDMCDMLSELSTNVPDWSPAACMPTPGGWVAFEKPVMTAPFEAYGTGEIFAAPISMIAWETKGNEVRITGWALHENVPSIAVSPIRGNFNLGMEELIGITLPTGAVVNGSLRIITDGVEDERFLTAGDRMQSLIGATWLLLSQPRMVRESDSVVSRVKKRPSGGGKRRMVPVRVSITSLVVSTPPESGGGGATGRKATTRWWVRGHWRQQAWGKNRALRKPVWIAPHTAGAADAEVDKRPHVQVWRTGEGD